MQRRQLSRFATNISGSFHQFVVNGTLLDSFEEVERDFKESFYTYRDPVVASIIAVYVFVFLFSVLGNILVLLVIHSNKTMRSVTNLFLLNLAVADLLVAVVCVPLTVGELVYKVWLYGAFLCKATGYLQGVSIGASVMTIMFLSIDRYVAIKHPVKSRRFSTTGHVIATIVLVWAISLSIMAPLAVMRMLEEYTLSSGETLFFCHERWSSKRARKIFDLFLFVFIYVIPGGVIIFSYMSTGFSLMHRDKSLRDQEDTTGTQNRMMAGRRRVAWMLLLVAILFAMSWLPYHVCNLYVNFVKRVDAEHTLVVLSFSLLLGHSHSAQNPILYCILNRPFKRGVALLLKCQKQEHFYTDCSQQIDRQDSLQMQSSCRRHVQRMTSTCTVSSYDNHRSSSRYKEHRHQQPQGQQQQQQLFGASARPIKYYSPTNEIDETKAAIVAAAAAIAEEVAVSNDAAAAAAGLNTGNDAADLEPITKVDNCEDDRDRSGNRVPVDL